MTLRFWLRTLLACVLGLPIVQTVLWWTAGLLAAMDDHAAAAFVRRVGAGAAILWLVCLVGLVVAAAIDTALQAEPGHPER